MSSPAGIGTRAKGRPASVSAKAAGALTHVEQNGRYVIRGASCPLSALTGKHPGGCLAMESLVSEIVGVRTRECCERDERPRCCFVINTGKPSARKHD
jgi:hypothetical protein